MPPAIASAYVPVLLAVSPFAAAAIDADDNEVDQASRHQRRRGRVRGGSLTGNVGLAKLPHAVRRLPCSGRCRSHRRKTVGPEAALRGEIDRGKRGPESAGRRRSRIAMRDDTGIGWDQGDPMLPDRPAHRSIFIENGRSLLPEPRVNHVRFTSRTRRGIEHSGQCPRKVRQRSAVWIESHRLALSQSVEIVPAIRSIGRRCDDEAHSAGDADGRGTADGQRANRIADVGERTARARRSAGASAPLIDDGDRAPLGAPPNGLNDWHAVKLRRCPPLRYASLIRSGARSLVGTKAATFWKVALEKHDQGMFLGRALGTRPCPSATGKGDRFPGVEVRGQ